MKQSLGLVILQVFGIALGFVSVFYVAGTLSAEVYAVVGIYNVISIFIVVFSNTGIETYGIRNILALQEIKEDSKIKLIVTQAIFYRTILACIVVFPIVFYAIYVSEQKFQGQYLELFLFMSFLSITKAINDSSILLLRAFNKYFAAALATYSVNVFGRLLALFLFIQFGFNSYIYTIILLPLLVTIPVIYMLREWISLEGVFQKENLLKVFKESKSFALSGYISYAFNFLDQLLVSIFMSAEVLGSFSVAKSIYSISKTFIENIFDPIVQDLVRYKNNSKLIDLKLGKIFKIRNILLLISLLILPFVIIYINELIMVLGLDKYLFLNYFVVFIYLSQIASIAMKVKFNYIALFYEPSFYLRLTIIYALLSILFFTVVIVIDIKFIFSHMLLTNLILIIYTNKLFNNKGHL
jgi:O-antigen/teichoic acid export membrane protein